MTAKFKKREVCLFSNLYVLTAVAAGLGSSSSHQNRAQTIDSTNDNGLVVHNGINEADNLIDESLIVALEEEPEGLFALCAVNGNNGSGIEQVVGIGCHTLGAERFNALVIAIYSLTGVVDDGDAAVSHLHGNNSGVNIRNAGLFLELRVNEAGADSGDFNSFRAGDVADHVEVMDHHIIEDTAGNSDIGSRGRLRVAGGNDNNVGIANGAVLDSVSHRLVVVVEAAVEADLELDTLLFDLSEEVFDLGNVIVNGLLAEYMLASLYSSEGDIAMGVGG